MNAPDRPVGPLGAVLCGILGILAVACGIAAAVADVPGLALGAAVAGAGAAGLGVLIDVRRARIDRSLWHARAQARRLRRRLEALQIAIHEEERLTVDFAPAVTAGSDDWGLDPVSGLLRERHLPVVIQHVVASARRKVLPVSVVFWELDGLHDAAGSTRDEAIAALGAVAWRTLRESDAMFRLGMVAAVAVLVDTTEDGALVVAERVRESLRASPIGGSFTASAGIACYPTHALDAAELVSRAGRALEAARARGHERDYVAVAVSDT